MRILDVFGKTMIGFLAIVLLATVGTMLAAVGIAVVNSFGREICLAVTLLAFAAGCYVLGSKLVDK